MREMIERIQGFFAKNKWAVVFLLAIPFFNDGYLNNPIISDNLMDRFKIFVFVILLGLFIYKKRKPSPLLICLFVMEAWWFITTAINYGFAYSNALYKTTIDIINALSVAMIVEFYKGKGEDLVDGLMLNLELALYPNFVTVFTQHAERGYYLLGYYAVLILWILPAICVAALYMCIHKKYIRGSILIAVSVATAIITWCATIVVALMGMAFAVALGIFLYRNKKTSKFRFPLWTFVVLALLGNLFLLFVYSGGSFPFIDLFIEKFLGRSTTFTGRTPIWEKAIQMFMEKPLIGYGFRPVVIRADGFEAMHAHNMLLQRLIATGVIGLILFVVFHILLILRVDKMKNSIARIVMIGGVFAINITYLMDAYKKFFRFYLVFFLAYHVDQIIQSQFNKQDHLLD